MLFGAFRPQTTTEDKKSQTPTRIPCHAALDAVACAPFSQGKAHEVRQRHQSQQEIRGSEADLSRPAPARRGACRGGICSSADFPWKCSSTARSPFTAGSKACPSLDNVLQHFYKSGSTCFARFGWLSRTVSYNFGVCCFHHA